MSVARIFRTPTPYHQQELAELDHVQAFDVVYLAHLNHAPTQLVRSSHTNWAFAPVTLGPTIAAPAGAAVHATVANTDADNGGNAYFPRLATYAVTAINDVTGQESRPSSGASASNDLTLKRNKNVVTWGAVTSANRYRVYKANHESAFGYIGETQGTSFTDDNIDPDLSDGPPEANNPFGPNRNPSTVTFFDQRLIWARTREVPNGVFTSRSADFANMDIARPARADDAISIRISAQKVNSVHALVPLQNLIALTGDGVFVIAGSDGDYLSAAPPPMAKRQSGRGASRLKPLVLDEAVFFQPAVGSGVRSLGFTFEIEGYRSNDVSIFSPELFRGHTIASWAYAEEPLSVVWTARSDGKVPTFTWQLEQQVWGWTLCETAGKVESICSIPEGGESRVYWVVEREIAGVKRRFLERLASAKWSDLDLSCYLDCAVTFRLEAPQRRFLVPHLAGATVDAMADGFAIRGLACDGAGWVDLGHEASRLVTIGLGYEALIETLPLAVQAESGSIQAKRQMLGDVVVQVADTRLGAIEVGRRLDRMQQPRARTTEPLGTPSALFTGAAVVGTEPVTAGEATLFIRSREPLPMTVTSVFLDPVVSEA